MSEDFENAPLAESMGRVLTAAEVEQVEAEARTAAYHAELAEIASLREGLKGDTLAGRDLSLRARQRGREILNHRLAVTEAMYYGKPVPEPPKVEPVTDAEPVKVEPLPWPKSARIPNPRVVKPPKSKATGRGRFRDSPRQVARRAGHRHYWSGGLCVRGHNSARFVSTGHCTACQPKPRVTPQKKRGKTG